MADKLKLTQEVKEYINTRRKVVEEFSGTSTCHRELQKKLNEACEIEDFEAVER
ncbi:hypothetical protein HAX54_039009, partial [Datura stramonium]|nr:hypothetical protein [Datura stramonium]